MSQYAVIISGGQQHKVSPNETLAVAKLAGKQKEKIIFSQVLLVVDGDKIKLGQPLVKDAKVQAEIVRQFKGEKIRVAKFKAKSRYRRVRGHRQQLTLVKIVKITV